jgi:hypothetical protein
MVTDKTIRPVLCWFSGWHSQVTDKFMVTDKTIRPVLCWFSGWHSQVTDKFMVTDKTILPILKKLMSCASGLTLQVSNIQLWTSKSDSRIMKTSTAVTLKRTAGLAQLQRRHGWD